MGRSLAALGCSTLLLCVSATGVRAQDATGTDSARSVEQAILSEPGGMEKVLSLQDDPNVRSLLRDESVLRAIRSGDYGALARDARVESLMRNPTVRDLTTDVQK